MPIYQYKGIDRTGKEVKGNITTDSVNHAKQKLKAQKIAILAIKEQKAAKSSDSGFSFGKKVSVDELALMTRQLSTLIAAKIPITEALTALVDQVESPTLKRVLDDVNKKVKEGSSLNKALADHPSVFDNIYINMVEAGEASGTLQIVLVRLAEFTEGQMKLKSKVSGALIYPAIIASVSVLVMNGIFIFVIPKITKIFASRKMELPVATKISIWISNTLQNQWHILLVSLIFGVFFLKKYLKTKGGKSKWDRLMIKLPLISKMTVMINVSRFCSTLATLLNSGVPIIAAMRIVENLITNVHIKKIIEQAKERVSEGKSMTVPLTESNMFPPMVTHMISLGEKTGELEPMLNIVSENYENQIDSQLTRITAVLNPMMMLVLGVMVFFIVISVIVPIMNLNSVRK